MEQKENNNFLYYSNTYWELLREDDPVVVYYIRFHTGQENKFVFIYDDYGCVCSNDFLKEYEITYGLLMTVSKVPTD